MRRTVGRTAIILAVAVLCFGCAKTDYDALFLDAEKNFTSIKTYQLKPSLYIPQAGTDAQVEAWFQSPNKIKAEVTYPITVTLVCDGKKLSGCAPDYNTCISLPLDQDNDFLPPLVLLKTLTPHLNFVNVSEKYDHKMEGKEDLEGKKCIVFVLTRKEAPKEDYQAATAKVWIEESSGNLLKMEGYDNDDVCKTRSYLSNYAQVNGVWMPQDLKMELGDGMPLATMSVSDIKVNEDIPASTFTFTPPSDSVVLDEIPGGGGGDMPEFVILD